MRRLFANVDWCVMAVAATCVIGLMFIVWLSVTQPFSTSKMSEHQSLITEIGGLRQDIHTLQTQVAGLDAR